MELEEEELIWQAMQIDTVPHPHSPPDIDGDCVDEQFFEQQFLPHVAVPADPSHERDFAVSPAGPSQARKNTSLNWLVEPVRSFEVSAPAAGNEPAEDNRWFPLEGGFNNQKHPHRRAGEIQGTCMSITGPCGNRVYAKTLTEEDDARKSKIFRAPEGPGLLSTPINVLLEQAEESSFEQARTTNATHPLSGGSDAAMQRSQDELWVDKYAPRSFTQLSSDERVNREVVRWLKEWDPCVFGRELAPGFHKNKSIVAESGFQKNKSIVAAPGFDKNKYSLQQSYKKQMSRGMKGGQSRPTTTHETHLSGKIVKDWARSNHGHVEPMNMVPSDRPAERVLLLSGPPGLGKTTLAHVAARHCGYHVVEINASDDRAAATLQAKIMNAVEMKSVMADGRPNCLVIDEIDGAQGGPEGKSAIDTLVKLISAENQPTENVVQQTTLSKKAKRKGKHTVRLLRPVICICNDLYAPALRNLRTVARVCTFLPPSCNRIATRLKQVCISEGYPASASALTVLAEHTECDMRLCLHTLQFLHTKKQTLDMSAVASQVLGSKSIMPNIAAMWKEMFQSSSKQRKASKQIETHNHSNGGSDQVEFHRLYDILTNNADFDLADKVHDHLLGMRFSDSSLQKLVNCLKILGDTDIATGRSTGRQHYQSNAYQHAHFLALRKLITQQETPHLFSPTISQRLRSDLKVKKEMLRDWQSNMSVGAKRVYSFDNLSEDLVSPFLSIMAPRRLRPIALQMLTGDEKREVKKLIDCMLTYGVTYKQSKGDASMNGFDGSKSVLEPPLQTLIMFQNHIPRRLPLAGSILQMLGHEAEMERIRLAAARAASRKPVSKQSEELVEQDDPHGRLFAVTSKTSDNRSSDASAKHLVHGSSGKMDTPPLMQIPAKTNKRRPHDLFHFFARAASSSGKEVADFDHAVQDSSHQGKKHPITFKYHEGFTNAVKRPMFVREFKM